MGKFRVYLRSMLGASIVERKNYFPYIDGLRGIAILMVLLVHGSHMVGNSHTGSFKYLGIERFVNSGSRGVQLFFILSAFTLFSSSRHRFNEDKKPVQSFYVRRAFRILPFWFIAVAVWSVLLHKSLVSIFLSITFLFGFVNFIPSLEVVPGGWSLFVEETFYIFLPLIFAKITNLYSALTFLISMLLLSVAWLHFAPRIAIFNQNSFAYLFPFSQWFAFGLGILLFFLISHKCVMKFVFEDSLKYSLLDILALITLIMLLGGDFILATFSLFFLSAASVPSGTFFGKVTRIPLLMRFGKYCYSIYLTHFLLMYISIGWLLRLVHLNNAPVEIRLLFFFPIFAGVSLGLAFFTYNWIEKPCVVFGKKVISRLNGPSPNKTASGKLRPATSINK